MKSGAPATCNHVAFGFAGGMNMAAIQGADISDQGMTSPVSCGCVTGSMFHSGNYTLRLRNCK